MLTATAIAAEGGCSSGAGIGAGVQVETLIATRSGRARRRIARHLRLTVHQRAAVLQVGIFIVGQVLLFGRDAPGYASMITVVLFLGGLQLIGLGVLGEYLGRIYMESKGRPIYIVREDGSPAQQDTPKQHHHAP